MTENLSIAGLEISPGSRRTIDLPLGGLYTHTEMTMPVHVVHGRREGPRLFVSAAIHGDEVGGVEIIRRLLRLKLLRQIRGALIAVPVVNVYGFVSRSRYLPDRRDLNRSFPGSEKGSLTARVASIFMEQIVPRATHGIDLHTGSDHRENLPQIRASLDDEETARLARSFGVPVIIDARTRDGSLRQAVTDRGAPMLLYEAGEALRFNEVAIRTGLRGIVSVMREIGMLPRRSSGRRLLEPLIARSTSWVRAPRSGILFRSLPLGTAVRKGDRLGTIGDGLGEIEEPFFSDCDGVIIGLQNLPLVHEGDALFHIATIEGPTSGAEIIEAFQAEMEEDGNRILPS